MVVMKCQRCSSFNVRAFEPDKREQKYRGLKPGAKGGQPAQRGMKKWYTCKDCNCEFWVWFDHTGKPSKMDVTREGMTRETDNEDFFYAADEGK